MSLDIVILAAGKGTRMYSALPKVLHRLAGRPLLSHVVHTARSLKPQRIVIVYGHGGDQVPQTLRGDDLMFVEQEPQLGTGHAVQQALPKLTAQRTLVLYGDVPLIAAATLQRALSFEDGLILITASPEDPTGYGRIVRDGTGAVVRIVEQGDASPEQKAISEINTGILAAPTFKLASWLSRIGNDNVQREFYLTDVVSLAVADGTSIHTAQPADLFETLGVNSKQQLAHLERIHQRENAAQLMDAGVTLADPLRLDVRGSLACGADVRIDVNCVFEGNVKLGDHVEIGAHCVVKDTEIGAGTRVEPFSHIDTAKIGANCRIGPYARLRPGARLAQEVHIGNFVEVKEADIGARTKANHLSYIGDATLGRDVNIGAGTITCNFDGVAKHRTVIEDEVFIGSDTQLVAPVRVRRGAFVGAGTTVTKDVPAHALALSRARQENKEGWAKRFGPAARKDGSGHDRS